MMAPSPVRFTMRPWCAAMAGSNRSLRSPSPRVAGALEVTVAGRFAPRKYQAPPAIAMSATIPAPSSASIGPCFAATGSAGFACAALPTSSE
jgi:hypothetical protein